MRLHRPPWAAARAPGRRPSACRHPLYASGGDFVTPFPRKSQQETRLPFADVYSVEWPRWLPEGDSCPRAACRPTLEGDGWVNWSGLATAVRSLEPRLAAVINRLLASGSRRLRSQPVK